MTQHTLFKIGVPTISGNVYSREIAEEIISQFKNRETSYGQIDVEYSEKVDFEKVSHLVEDLFIKDDEVIADIRILKTPCGILLEQTKDHVRYGVVSRAYHTVDETGNRHLFQPYVFVRVDAYII